MQTAELSTLPRPKIVFSDFDGTLTDHTEFSPTFLDILTQLKAQEVPLIIVTGRSISWAHFLLTHFASIEHVIAEGGGVHAYKDERGHIQQHTLIEADTVKQLSNITQALTTALPNITLSADSLGRLTDRAIELEDLQADPALMAQVEDFLKQEGAQYSTSNVHLNFWCGEIDKFTAIEYFRKKYHPAVNLSECVFFGDSLNDQSVFQHMSHTIGVANISDVLDRMTHQPSVILTDSNHNGPQGVAHVLKNILV